MIFRLIQTKIDKILPQELIDKIDKINSLKHDGFNLYTESSFLQAWAEAFESGPSERLVFELVEVIEDQQTKTIGLMFLTRTRKFTHVVYEPCGAMFGYFTPCTYPGYENEFVKQMINHFSAIDRAWKLKLPPSRTNWINQNSEHYFQSKIQKDILENNAPFIELENYKGPVRKSLRNSITNAHNRIKNSTVEFEEIINLDDSNKVYIESLLNTLEFWHKEQWPNSNFSRKGDEFQKFYRNLVKISSSSVRPVVHLLRIDGDLAALHLGFYLYENLYYWSPISDKSRKFYSPSKLLLEKIINNARNSGVKIFDFMNDDEPYKFDWTNESASRFRYTFASHNFYLPKYDKFKLRNLVHLALHTHAVRNFLKSPIRGFKKFLAS